MELNQICTNGILEFTIRNDIGYLSINNPPLNKMPEPAIATAQELKLWFSEPTLRGVILYSTARHFSMGADVDFVNEAKHDAELLKRKMREGRETFDALYQCPVPVVAAIQRGCFGGGLEIALSCHIRVASENAQFGFPESTLGFMPGLGGTCLAERIVGSNLARRMILKGNLISADEALEAGLIHYLTDNKSLLATAEKVLNEMITNKSPDLIRKIVKSINNSIYLEIDDALEKEQQAFCELLIQNMPDEEHAS